MKTSFAFAPLLLGSLLCVAPAASHATHYAVCVGVNQYKTSYIGSSNWLNGCVPDANHVWTHLTERGEWTAANTTKLLNSAATVSAIRTAITGAAASAVSGDVFVYYHSSHGWSIEKSGNYTTDVGLCTYNDDYTDAELASDLAQFKSGVKVVVMVDACHSGGLFKTVNGARALSAASPGDFDLAARVSAAIDSLRADETARGIKDAARIASSEIGWVTAADYYQYSWDGSNGGAFTEAALDGWDTGTCDNRTYGDQDGYANFYELWNYAKDIATGYSGEDHTDAQCFNESVLRATIAGWVGDEEPSGVRFAPIPEQTATVGAAFSYTLFATNATGFTGAIAYSVESATAPASTYSLNGSAFSFTPVIDGAYSFTFLATNATAHTFGRATMSVQASLAAPEGLDNTGISATSFTANWDAVPGAASYVLEVYVAEDEGDASAVNNDFKQVSSADDLTEGEYVILAENTDNAMNNTCSGASSGYLSYEEVTIVDSTISTDDDSIIWTLAGDASACTLFNAAAGMYVNPAASKSIGWAADASGAWVLSMSDGIVTAANAADASWKLQYNANSPRFMCYSSSQKKLRFFRRDGASAVFSADVGAVTSYTVEGLIPGDYTWRVRAIGNAKGPWSEPLDVTLFADPSAPPSIRAIDDIAVTVGETVELTVHASAPEEAPITSLVISAGGDAPAFLMDGVFSFTPAAPGSYSFTITAINANGFAEEGFTVTATLAEPETPTAPTVVSHNSFTASWTAVPGATGYELVVIEGAGSGDSGDSGDSGNTQGQTLTETFTNATFTPGGNSYVDQTIVGDLGTWSATQCQVNDRRPVVRYTGSMTSPTFSEGVSSVEFDYSWPYSESATAAIDLYLNGTKADSKSIKGGTAGTATYTFTAVSGSTTVEFRNTATSSQKHRVKFDEIRITTAGSRALSRAVGDVVFSNAVGNVTSYVVTGLQPETEYTFAIRALAGDEATEWSAPVSVTTTAAPAAPAWSEIPALAASVGIPFRVDLAPYVSGNPAPTLTLTAGDATLSGTVLEFTPAAAGSSSFTVSAANGVGAAASATFSVAASVHEPVQYALCVGIDEYEQISGLNGCVNDSVVMASNLVERGGWLPANVTLLNDSAATKAAIRGAISNIVEHAVAGDTFVYQHSSHGGQFNATEDDEPLTGEDGKDTFLCVYDEDYYDNTTAYNDYEIAADLAAFPAGVKVVVIVDACHSGGLFKSKAAAKAAAASFDLAGRVTALMDADRARRRARGEDVARTLSSSEIGWATAAEYYEYSFDGGFYHTDEWLTDVMYGEEYFDENYEVYNYPASYRLGGVFLTSATWGWWNGTADTDAEAGDNDGLCDAYELWKKGYDFCSVVGEFWYDDSDYNYFPQCANIDVLRSVELGWVVDPRPAAPAEPAASGVTSSSFTATWDAVSNAVSYLLHVQKKVPDNTRDAESVTLLSESFEDGEIPVGWTASSGVGIASGKDGDGTYCVKFTASGASLVTPALENPDSVAFLYKRSKNTADWSLDVSVGPSADGPWTSVGAVNDAGDAWQAFSAPISASGTAYVKFTDTRSSGVPERYIDLVVVTGSTGTWEDLSGYAPLSVAGTSQLVSGLDADADYRYTVRSVDADGLESVDSARVTVHTAAADSAPVWGQLPPLSCAIGGEVEFTATDYVTAVPDATVTLASTTAASADYEYEDGYLVFVPSAAGEYTFTFTAENTIGSASATLTVTVAATPVTVPTLTISDVSNSGALASWTACDGVASYTLQLASDDQFTTGGSGGEVTLFSNDGTDATSAPTGWTYDLSDKTSTYLLMFSGHSVVSEAVDASACTDLSVSLYIRTYGGTSQPNLAIQYSTDNGTSWLDAGTVAAANSTMAQRTLALPAAAASSALRLRFAPTTTSSSIGVGIKTLVLTGTGNPVDGSLIRTEAVTDAFFSLNNLDENTTYYARVKGDSDWSNVEMFTTTGSGIAPVTVPTLTVSGYDDTTAFATWTACDNVAEYTIQLATDDQFTAGSDGGPVLEADFSDTTGWTLSGTGTYTGSGYCGAGSPSIKFDGTGDYAISPDFGSGVRLTFWAYGNGGSDSTFAISGLVDGSWQVIETVTIAQGGITYEVDLPFGTSQVRFDFTKSVNCALDDVVVYGAVGAGSLIGEFTTTDTFYGFSGLTPETTYYARVKGDAGWSNVEEFTTEETVVDAVPALSVSPDTFFTVAVGEDVEFTVTATGIPAPDVSVFSNESANYLFLDGEFRFTPTDPGTYTFEFTASNVVGTDTVSVTVEVLAIVPTLAVSNITSTTAFASWNNCANVMEYTLQLSTNEQFEATGGAMNISEDFSGFTPSTRYSTEFQTVDSGTWSYENAMLKPGASAAGAGSVGYAQLHADDGILYLPALDTPSAISVVARASGDNGTLKLQKEDNGSWTDLESWALTSIAVEYTYAFAGASASTALRLCAMGRAVYIHDVTVFGESSSPDGTGTFQVLEGSGSSSYTFTDLLPDTTYYARVKGNDEWSNVVEFHTLAGPANLAEAFGLPVGITDEYIVCRITSFAVGADDSVSGTFAVTAEDEGTLVAESSSLSDAVQLVVLGAAELGDFAPLDATQCGVELTSRTAPFAFRVARPGTNRFFQVKLVVGTDQE